MISKKGHFTEVERAQAEITESGNPRKPEGEDGKKMLERMNESHHNVTGWALSLWEIQGNDNILDIGCGGGAALSRMAGAGDGRTFCLPQPFCICCAGRSIRYR